MNLFKVERGPDGILRQTFTLPDWLIPPPWPGPSCQNLCGHKLSRPHFTCSPLGYCRIKRIWRKQLENPLKVDEPVILFPRYDRRFKRAKAFLASKIISIVNNWLMN